MVENGMLLISHVSGHFHIYSLYRAQCHASLFRPSPLLLRSGFRECRKVMSSSPLSPGRGRVPSPGGGKSRNESRGNRGKEGEDENTESEGRRVP